MWILRSWFEIKQTEKHIPIDAIPWPKPEHLLVLEAPTKVWEEPIVWDASDKEKEDQYII